MKKIISLPLAALIIFALLCSNKSYAGEDMFTKGFTIKFAYIMPASDFGSFDEDKLGNVYKTDKVNSGFGFHLGTMYFINALDLGDKFKLGIDVTWMAFNYTTVSYNYENVPSAIDQLIPGGSPTLYSGNFDATHVWFYPEIGPMISYGPNEKIALDLSLKLSPTFGGSSGSYVLENGESQAYGGIGSGFLFTPAFYFRYNVFLLGAEYSIGSLNSTYKFTGDVDFEDINESTSYSNMRIVLGFKF